MTLFYDVPVGVRTAASLLLLRDGSAGLEVLMLQRAERSDGDMRSGVAVFPGGVLDARDRDAHAWCLGSGDAHWGEVFALSAGALDYAIAAVRETFEEVGVLLACAADGSAVDLAALAPALAPWRDRLHRGQATLGELCSHFNIRLDLRGLIYTAHWLTPPGLPKRWDTRFFTAAAPAFQDASPDGGEALAVMWTTPAAALHPDTGLKLLPAMRRMLSELQIFADSRTALAALAARGPVQRTMPRRAASSQGVRIVGPDDFAYAEVGRLDPDGRADVSCELLPGRAVALSGNVWRVTAPNPGPMTGPGTNSYLVGAGTRWTVIDPGPAIPSHQQALIDAAAAAGGRIERILVTHTHRDHSPGAAPLAVTTGAPVWGRVATHPEWQDDSFRPAHQPRHGEQIHVAPGLTLKVVHTPGHASNHLCFLLESEKLLFTGDHVMQGSTVVINPPDGDMQVYLQSLNALLSEDLLWLAPGHGFLVDQPHTVIRKLIAHRLAREAKVVQALQMARSASTDALLSVVYADVPAALHGVARRSLLAHLLKLRAQGVAGVDIEHRIHENNDAGPWMLL